eukprot:3051494-Prymnesium_polylepis.1
MFRYTVSDVSPGLSLGVGACGVIARTGSGGLSVWVRVWRAEFRACGGLRAADWYMYCVCVSRASPGGGAESANLTRCGTLPPALRRERR